MSAARPLVVIGIGNPWRGDDGAGWAAVDVAAARLGLDASAVVRSDGEPARLIDAWAGAELAVVVDAVRTGAPPGTVGRVEPTETGALAAASSHGLGLGAAVDLGRSVGQLPGRLVIVGIEAADTGAGCGLSPAVAAALPALADAIVDAPGAGHPPTRRV